MKYWNINRRRKSINVGFHPLIIRSKPMPYNIFATSVTPALIIYVIDIGASMQLPLSGKRRIDIVIEIFKANLIEMISHSIRGSCSAPLPARDVCI